MMDKSVSLFQHQSDAIRQCHSHLPVHSPGTRFMCLRKQRWAGLGVSTVTINSSSTKQLWPMAPRTGVSIVVVLLSFEANSRAVLLELVVIFFCSLSVPLQRVARHHREGHLQLRVRISDERVPCNTVRVQRAQGGRTSIHDTCTVLGAPHGEPGKTHGKQHFD